MSHNEDTDPFDADSSADEIGIGDQETVPPATGQPDDESHGEPHDERWERTQDIDSDRLESQFEARAETPNLVIISGARAGEACRIREGRTLLGRRRAKVDIWFRDPGASRVHAAVDHEDGQVMLSDLGSSNGTFVNGDRIDAPTPLHEGDKITLGNAIVLKFTRQDALDEQFQRKMYESSIRDELTETYSRSYLIEQMRSEMAYASRHATPLALLFIDLDRFKEVNDTYGHVIGDEVLIELAERLDSTLRDEDLLARYGGEEFAILVRNVSTSYLQELAERIRQRIASQPFETEHGAISLTVSVGIAEYDAERMQRPDDWICAADEAMYRAKEAGRNCVEMHETFSNLGGVRETLP